MVDYREKTYSKILEKQMERIPGNIDKREGSIIQLALGPESWYLEGLYLEMQHIQENIFVESAVGDSLDKLAEGHGMERRKALRAIKQGIFDKEIPLGFRASALRKDPYLVYKSIEYLGHKDGNYQYSMECETEGAVGNEYAGQLIPIDYVYGLTQAKLTNTILHGTDEESDDSLRARLMIKIRMPSTSGNKYDYYNWAMACQGVGAAKVFPLANGPGTVKVVISDGDMGAASPELVEQVTVVIEEKRPIGADVTVESAKEKPIDISAKIKLQNGVNLGATQDVFQNLVKEFLRGNAFHLSYVSMAQIGRILLETAGIEDYSEIKLNGSDGNVALADEEIAVAGSVVLEVMP